MMDVLLGRLKERTGNTQLWNLSDDPESVLPWDKCTIEEFNRLKVY